jgi:DNA-directed RNA polymerase subunit RPC12/RpoP
MPGVGVPTGSGPEMSPAAGPNFPSRPRTPEFPGMASNDSPLPAGPTFQQVYKCSGCQREISEAESSLTKCPHCGTLWIYKEDGSGNKQYSGVASPRSMAVGLLVVVGIIVLGAVGGFIGIIAAIVRAACKPPSHANYRRY